MPEKEINTKLIELSGPISIENDKLTFVKPASLLVTPIWYQYSIKLNKWMWTPYDPYKEKNLDWLDISILTVPYGFWKGEQPAQCNIKIILYLKQYNPKPTVLLESFLQIQN